jgi:preprotein translocase subunit SecB
MEAKEIKFFVKRIFTKDLSLESPESPSIFDNIKSTPKVAFNLNTTITEINETSYDITLDITVKAETDSTVIYMVELKQAGLFIIDGADDELKDGFLNIRCPEVLFPYARETISSLIQKAGFPPIFIAPIDFNALYQQELSKKTKQ